MGNKFNRSAHCYGKERKKRVAKDGEPVELFDIDKDPSEKSNLLADHPKVAEDLQKDLKAWLAEPRKQFGNIPN